MKAWSAALASNLSDWPQVSVRSFFGFTALYRGKTRFGLLPRTRSIFKVNAVPFRIEGTNRATKSLIGNDPHVSPFDEHKTRWFAFELYSDSDLHAALNHLATAFEAVRIPQKK